MTCLFQFFFIKCSNNFSTIRVFYYICLRHSIFNFFNQKNLRPISSVTFCKNGLIFWYSHMITNFEIRTFFRVFYSKVNICAWLYICAWLSFILVVLWYVFYSLIISANLSIYWQYKVLKSCVCKFCSLRF